MSLKESIRKSRDNLRFRFLLKKKADRLHAMNHNKEIIVFASDCTGGRIINDYGLPIYTPTVNTGFFGEDFLKFCENPDRYIGEEVIEAPCLDPDWGGNDAFEGRCGDIKLFFTHVSSFEEGLKNWNRRCRLYKKTLKQPHEFIVIMNDRNMFREELLPRFQKLPYKYKVLFTHKDYRQENTFYMKKEDGLEFVDTMTVYEHGLKRRYDRFDFVKWFEEIYNS